MLIKNSSNTLIKMTAAEIASRRDASRRDASQNNLSETGIRDLTPNQRSRNTISHRR
jgi:hypothetical protein